MRIHSLLLVVAMVFVATAHAEDSALSSERASQLMARYDAHLIPVNIWVKRWEGRPPTGDLGDAYKERRPHSVIGLAVHPRTVLIPDYLPDERYVDRVTVGEGGELKAKLFARPIDAFGWVLKTDDAIPGISELDFVPTAELPPIEKLTSIWKSREDAGWAMIISNSPRRFQHDQRGPAWRVGGGVLLVTADGRPAGFSFDRGCLVDTNRAVWPGAKLQASAILTQERYAELQREWEKRAADLVPTVRMTFTDEQEESNSRRSMWGDDDDDSGPNLIEAGGYVLGSKRVLVNHALSRSQALRIDTIEVIHNGHTHPARFVGAFRNFGAFVCELEEESTDLPETVPLDNATPFAHNQSLLLVAPSHVTGSRRVWVEFNRVRDSARGYRDVEEPILYKFQRKSSLVVNAGDQKIVGAVVEVRRVQSETERMYGRSGGIDLRVMTGAEIAEFLGEADYDPQLRPGDKQKRKAVVWLGVDYQELNRDLAVMHGVEIETEGGSRGVLVNHVFPGSPADRAGIVVGDVLLQFTDPKTPDPVFIRPRGDMDYRFPPPPELGEAQFGDYLAMIGPPWRNVRNYLNRRLTQIGAGEEITLTYLRDGEKVQLDMTLEESPPDSQSAPKKKVEALGITVRDLTYEVRDYYKLPVDAKGVVVSKVEAGSAAAVANVVPNAVIRELDGQAIDSAEAFQKLAEQLLADASRSLEVRLEYFGRSRLLRMTPGAQ